MFFFKFLEENFLICRGGGYLQRTRIRSAVRGTKTTKKNTRQIFYWKGSVGEQSRRGQRSLHQNTHHAVQSKTSHTHWSICHLSLCVCFSAATLILVVNDVTAGILYNICTLTSASDSQRFRFIFRLYSNMHNSVFIHLKIWIIYIYIFIFHRACHVSTAAQLEQTN